MLKTTASLIALLFILTQCNKKPSFIKLDVKEGETSSSGFSDYCKSFDEGIPNTDYIYNRYSEVKKVLGYNEKFRKKASLAIENSIDFEELIILEQELNNSGLTTQERELLGLMISNGRGDNDAEKVFENAELINASKYIIEQSENFHFLLLNEAHYSSQQRAFTKSLLIDLWAKGYRYLAIEALAYNEFNLNKRGYPTTKSGYYIQDPVFGNMVREAIRLGYKLVPYEISGKEYISDRERIQAKKIYERTYKNDIIGKVIVHAGFSHISKTDRGAHSLMGYYLNEYVKGKVLSVDQQTMSYVGENQNNDYYDFAINNVDIKNPSIFLEDDEVVIVPMSGAGFDILVYHPQIEFINGRPMWLYNSNKTSISLSKEIKKFDGMLIRAQYATEVENSVPVDQFVIDVEKQLILPSGDFIITIVDCDNKIIRKYSITI